MPSKKLASGGRGGQPDLFGALEMPLPAGFRYQPELITPDLEREFLAELEALPFEPFNFHGHLANRRVVSFGFRYDYEQRRVLVASPIPGFLMPLREMVAAFADRPAEAFAQILINEYRPGAGIGWHRDKPHFGEIAGVSLLAACDFRLRRRTNIGWDRHTITLQPRSVYLLAGGSRAEWEHSIPAVEGHRYSITFRTLRADTGSPQSG